MKLSKLKIKNFRGYEQEIKVDFDNFTAFVGKNDIGKSTILEALEIFFNGKQGIIKIDKDDINKTNLKNGITDIEIAVCFSNLPEKIILDSTAETTLTAEYLLNKENELEIIKRFPNAGSEKIFIKALHPTNTNCENLLLKKNSELKKIVTDLEISCTNNKINSLLRYSIWKRFESDLQLSEIEIDVSKSDETKSIWDNIKKCLPIYSLFQSDRKNSDGDNEVQDPLKEAVKQILNDVEIKEHLQAVATKVTNQLQSVAKSTLDKLQEMNPTVAKTLLPIIPENESLKWNDVFKNVAISSDEGIPINKRGSGIKRLILLNFFRAQAEKRVKDTDAPNVIYAIEEPETSQHYEHQLMLINALKDLSKDEKNQIIITTHSSTIVKQLSFSNLRLVMNNDSSKIIKHIEEKNLPYPSLNEVNYLAFNEVTEEYHNELYGFIEAENWLGEFKQGKNLLDYKRVDSKTKNVKAEKKILTEIIRHQIHHPENKENTHFTNNQLEESINLMKQFILLKRNSEE